MPWFHVQLLHAFLCNNCIIIAQELHAITAHETTSLDGENVAIVKKVQINSSSLRSSSVFQLT